VHAAKVFAPLHGFCTPSAPQIHEVNVTAAHRAGNVSRHHREAIMMVSGFRLQSSFLWKLVVAATLVGFGDLLFFQWELGGGNLGFYGVALLAGMIAARHGVRRDWRALLAALAALLFAFAMIYDANLLAWMLFWIATGMAALLPASGHFDDGWRWFQRLLLHGLRAPFAPMLDARRMLKASGQMFRC
jgi:signal transduction histidine kinase